MSNTSNHRIKQADTNYGVVGDNTLRTAAQIGNATGAADFGDGPVTAQTLRVVIAQGGSTLTQVTTYDEQPAVPQTTETAIVSYIPTNDMTLTKIMASGLADADFYVKINGVVVAKKRNNWVERNPEFDFADSNIVVPAGQTVELTVSAIDEAGCPFNGTILGLEQ